MAITRKIKERNREYARLRDTQFSLYENYARQWGLQSKSLLILLWIYRNPQGISQQTIAAHTYSTKQVVNAAIKSFARKGYLSVTVSGADKRKKLITLTTDGKAFAASIIEPMDRAEERAFSRLTERQQDILLRTTAVFSAELSEELNRLSHRKDGVN